MPKADERKIDTRVPHPARVYDYLLGGKDNFEADRRAGEEGIALFPQVRQSARAARAFLARAVRYLAGEAGIRQFLDIGTGLPSGENVHQAAQDVAPESRVVYVDYDPIVLLHAETLLTSTPEGVTAFLECDLREPEKILAAAASTLDFGQPVAVLLFGVLHFIEDSEDPDGIVRTLTDAVVPGSYLAINHLADDLYPEMVAFTRNTNAQRPRSLATLRSRERVTRFFDGLDLVEPGVVQISKWRARCELEAKAPGALWGGVARKTP
jgi:S-adenosyl methyltransferase